MKREQIICCISLCVACGIVDAMSFLRHGIFAANMTGNTVLLGISLAQLEWMHAFERATPLLVFFGGAMVARLLLTHTGRRPAIPLLLEAALLVMALGFVPNGTWSLSLITFAMGVQSTAVTQFAGVTLSTVVVTSTLARISEVFADRLSWTRREPESAPVNTTLPLYLLTWACYLIGALLAGIGGSQSLIAMLAAAVLVLVAAALAQAR